MSQTGWKWFCSKCGRVVYGEEAPEECTICFTPAISISTAIIEFILAIILILYFPRSKLRNFFALFIVMFGTYQFSEYLVCIGSNPKFWATVGIITYSFLPAAGFHAVLRTFHKKFSLFFVYIIPVIASIALAVIPDFVFLFQII